MHVAKTKIPLKHCKKCMLSVGILRLELIILYVCRLLLVMSAGPVHFGMKHFENLYFVNN